METPILIFGAQEKGRVALEIFQASEILVYGFLDDDKTLVSSETTYGHASVLGTTQDQTFLKIIGEKCRPFIALPQPEKVIQLMNQLSEGNKITPLNAIHPQAHLSPEVRLGAGNLIHAGTHIGNDTLIHSHCALMGNNMVGHGTTLHDFVYLGAGAVINPCVEVGEAAYIGSGAIIKAGITIGKGARIAPGTIVLHDVEAHTLVAGNPGQVLEKKA